MRRILRGIGSIRKEDIMSVQPDERRNSSIARSRVVTNTAFTEFPKTDINQSISSRFEYIAKSYPLHIALKTNEETLTYCDLNKRANQIARTLLSRNDKSNSSVAVLIDSNADTIAALLGVLKAG